MASLEPPVIAHLDTLVGLYRQIIMVVSRQMSAWQKPCLIPNNNMMKCEDKVASIWMSAVKTFKQLVVYIISYCF